MSENLYFVENADILIIEVFFMEFYMRNLVEVLWGLRLNKVNYLSNVGDVMRRLNRDSMLALKELENECEGSEEEADEDIKTLAESLISCKLVHDHLYKYLKKVRFEPCWNFKNRDLVSDLKPHFDQKAWNMVIEGCRFIENRNGLLNE